MFSKAILRKPGRSLVYGLRSPGQGIPDYGLALRQHAAYTEALSLCGLNIIMLDADESYPDSVFVEDTALLTPACAIITRPGAASRRGEEQAIRHLLRKHYTEIHEIKEPGTVEAGDIMMVGSHYYIGLSGRTNREGARQVTAILNKYGLTASIIELKDVLHLKTAVSCLENNTLLAAGEFMDKKEFADFQLLTVGPAESYAANCIWVNDNILMPEGYPVTREKLRTTGCNIIEIDTSEFRKLDGGLSCLSLRF